MGTQCKPATGRRWRSWTVPACVGAALCLGAASELQAQTHVGQYEAADIAYGSSLYATHCVACHGAAGEQVPGVNLRGGRYRNASSDRELTGVIRDGLPGTPMPPGDFSAPELVTLVAYLRNMDSVDLGSVALGDADRGRALFEGKGNCGSCHRVAGRGPRFAPDLSDIGTLRSAATLERTLLDPAGSLMPINRPVRAVLADGTVVNGRRLNEDSYTVQLIDERERLLSLEKARLREYTVLTSSQMPAYAEVFTADEIADVLAYLRSLKGVN